MAHIQMSLGRMRRGTSAPISRPSHLQSHHSLPFLCQSYHHHLSSWQRQDTSHERRCKCWAWFLSSDSTFFQFPCVASNYHGLNYGQSIKRSPTLLLLLFFVCLPFSVTPLFHKSHLSALFILLLSFLILFPLRYFFSLSRSSSL